MKVKELDAHLISKIAAGEVIERPASVVKELVENSIDARGSTIDIAVAGIEQFTVSDDGEGMTQPDVLLAIRRHTTSKIDDETDLFDIHTLGFRGEALASIVEVSRTTITSQSDGGGEGVQLLIEGGTIKSIKAAGRARGTTVHVADLFFNTPARRKFLKTEKTEFSHLTRIVKRYVFAYHDIRFRLSRNGKLVIDAPAGRSLRESVELLSGKELARELVEFSGEGPGLRLRGLASRPDSAVATRDRAEQWLYVNGRYVRDAGLQYALKKAYEGLLPREQHAAVILFIEIEPALVDVNVHPQKIEVRFANAGVVQGAAIQAIRRALMGLRPMPSLEKMGASVAQSPPSFSPPSPPAPPVQSAASIPSSRPLASPESRPEPANWHLIGQLHNTYIFVETPEGLEIVDQHVAHERVLFEAFLEQIARGKIARQRLLIPLSLELPLEKVEMLASRRDYLDQRLGIELERLGPTLCVLRGWPQALGIEPAKESLSRILDRILRSLNHEAEPSLEELATEVVAYRACEAAVVKNTALQPAEMIELIRRLKATQNPWQCPHGRPITVAYPLADLEKRFGRR